jgi:hypothetical protein
MRVFEARRVFQSIADGAIHSDVGEPDECELQAGIGVGEDADDSERDRERVVLASVIPRGRPLRTPT